MNLDTLLRKGISYIKAAHQEQVRKFTGEDYYLHPIRVMEQCKELTSDPALLLSALLHDVLEDTDVTLEQLTAFVGSVMPEEDMERCTRYVVELTDIFIKENYPQWNRKYRKMKELERLKYISPEAQTIKYADILDNATDISSSGSGFADKLLKEYLDLLHILDKGNPAIRDVAYRKVSGYLIRTQHHSRRDSYRPTLKRQ